MVKEAKGWSPYTLNGGTVVAVAGEDFCIVAGDTRVSHGYSIGTRDGHRVTKLCDIFYFIFYIFLLFLHHFCFFF